MQPFLFYVPFDVITVGPRGTVHQASGNEGSGLRREVRPADQDTAQTLPRGRVYENQKRADDNFGNHYI